MASPNSMSNKTQNQANSTDSTNDIGRFVLHLESDSQLSLWVAKAFQWNIHQDLSQFKRLEIFNSQEFQRIKCPPSNSTCYYQLMRENDIDAFLIGRVSRDKISYKIYDTFRRIKVADGNYNISKGTSPISIRLETIQAFKPYLEKGGLIDQKALYQSQSTAKNEDSLSASGSTLSIIFGLFVFLLLISTPIIFLFMQKELKQNPSYKRTLNLTIRFSAVGLLCLLILVTLFVLNALKIYTIEHFIDATKPIHNLFYIMGGSLWGILILVNFRFVIPHLTGIESIKSRTLFSYFKSWNIISYLKLTALTLIYGAICLVLWWFAKNFGLGFKQNLYLFIPLCSLYLFFWTAIMLECLSLDIDERYCAKPYKNHAWHIALKKYFIGYLKRHSISIDKGLIDRIDFTIGDHKLDQVFSYGSYLFRPRIILSEDLVKKALGQRPYQQFENLDPVLKDSPSGQLKPFRKNKNIAVKRKGFIQKWLFALRSTPYPDREVQLEKKELNHKNQLGEFENSREMIGVVTPILSNVQKGSIPLIADDKEDLNIVNELLSEHKGPKTINPEDIEIDDTDPRDCDFLFGVILREVGTILRNDHILSTLSKCYVLFPSKSKPSKKRSIPFIKKHYSRIQDSFTVFNQGAEHLMQYYYFLYTNKNDHLTRRGNRKERNLIHIETINQLAKIKERVDVGQLLFIKKKMLWLSRFTESPIITQGQITFNKMFKNAALAGSFFMILIYLAHSIAYNREYESILVKEKKKIEKLKNKLKDKKLKDRK
jgi:hypothetical protein